MGEGGVSVIMLIARRRSRVEVGVLGVVKAVPVDVFAVAEIYVRAFGCGADWYANLGINGMACCNQEGD